MKMTNKGEAIRYIAVIAVAAWAQCSLATDGKLKITEVPSGISQSLARETLAALQRSQDWLLATQHPDGYWSSKDFPALTALALWALVDSGCNDASAMDKAVRYILGCVHENGAIYVEPTDKRKGGGLPNYNTAICMIALHRVGKPELVPVILKARSYLAASQLHGDSVYSGGMGYDPGTGRDYTDLSNSYIAYEAMYLTGI